MTSNMQYHYVSFHMFNNYSFCYFQVLWEGSVTDPNVKDDSTEAIRALNRKLYHDNRVRISMLLIADGVTLVFKK